MAKAVQQDAFEAFKDAIDKQTGDGRDLDRAREIADQYISEHPEQFVDFVGLSAADMADAATVLNAAGPAQAKAAVRVEMWVRSRFETQQIGGTVEAIRREIPGFDEEMTNA